MSAEYGRTQSGVFNYVMKSGINQVHGSLYFGFRTAPSSTPRPNRGILQHGVRLSSEPKRTLSDFAPGKFRTPDLIPLQLRRQGK